MAISKSRKQTIGRPQVDASTAAPGMVVAARPSNYKTPSVKIDKRGASGLRGIAEGIASLAPFLNRERIRANEAEQQREFMVGQKLRSQLGALDTAGFDKFIEENDINGNRNRARGAMAAHGRAQGMAAKRQLSEFVQQNGNSIVTDEQLTQTIGSFYAKDLEGMEDADFIDNYLGVMGTAEGVVREAWQKDQYLRTQTEARGNITEGLKGDLTEAQNNGADSQQLHSIMRGYYDLASINNVDRNAMNEIAFETVAIAAEEASDPSMLDVFDIASNDVDNPETRIPGLASSPKWQARIHDERVKIERSAVTKTTKQNEMDVYNARYEIDSAMDNGEWEKAIQLSKQGVADKLWSGERGANIGNSIRTEQKAEEVRFNQKTAYNQNRFWSADMTLAERQDIVDEDAREVVGAFPDMNPIDQAASLQVMREHQSQNATMDSSSRNLIKETSAAADPDQFVAAHETFNAYRAINPRNLLNQVGEDAWRTHMMFQKALFAYGDTGRAIQFVQEFNTPEARKAASDATSGRAGFEMRDKIRQELIKGKYFEDDASGSALVIDKVVENAMVYFAPTGDLEDAIEFGIDVFKARHHKVDFPDGSGSRWVDYGDKNLPEDWSDTEKAFSNDPDVRAKLGLAEGESVYLQQNPLNPGDRNMLVMKSDGSLIPVADPNSKRVGPWKVNPDQLINDRRTAQQASELEAANKKAIEDNKANQLQNKIKANASSKTDELIDNLKDSLTAKSGLTTDAETNAANTQRDAAVDSVREFTKPFTKLFKKPQK